MNLIKDVIKQFVSKLATYCIKTEETNANLLLERFKTHCQAMTQPRILELGTKRSKPDCSTKHDYWIPNAREYLGIDIADGADVDIVADVHRLSEVVGEEEFDAVVSCSSFEHFKYPHLAAHEIMKVLKVGGMVFIQTHQTHGIHAYPYDYFRFSREGLAGLFGERMGFRVIGTDYEFPARIYARQDPNAWRTSSFLNVCLLGEKVDKTPQDYYYEFDI